MTDPTLLFTAPMVRGLLSEVEAPGTGKTQTRRILKPQPCTDAISKPFRPEPRGGRSWVFMARVDWSGISYATQDFRVPYAIGDRIWCRETWSHTGSGVWTTSDARLAGRGGVIYRADAEPPGVGWFPSIFMPREFSRLTLTVTDVRVQRVQEISADDAVAEGITSHLVECADGQERNLWFGVPHAGNEGPTQAYADLWESLHNPRGLCPDDAPISWASNPWVVALTFTVAHRNIDAECPRNAPARLWAGIGE